MISAIEQVATREWVKVPNIPGLYRNTVSGRYYGFKKIRGRRRERKSDFPIFEVLYTGFGPVLFVIILFVSGLYSICCFIADAIVPTPR